jgi:transcriptional regulator with XRE-family HTH domain
VEFDSFLRQVGENIRRARWLAGLTQEEVAAKGLTYRYFQELERGRRNPTARTLFMLARQLGTSVSMLTQTTEDARSPKRVRLADMPASPPKRGRKPSMQKRPAQRKRRS